MKLDILFDTPDLFSTAVMVNGRVAPDDEVEKAVSRGVDIFFICLNGLGQFLVQVKILVNVVELGDLLVETDLVSALTFGKKHGPVGTGHQGIRGFGINRVHGAADTERD